jgi:penicillin-binding protein 1A
MDMPEGIVSVLIDRATGCPARAGQPNTMFEYFREGHVPECDTAESIPDIFNDASGTDRRLPEPSDAESAPGDEPDIEEESLF